MPPYGTMCVGSHRPCPCRAYRDTRCLPDLRTIRVAPTQTENYDLEAFCSNSKCALLSSFISDCSTLALTQYLQEGHHLLLIILYESSKVRETAHVVPPCAERLRPESAAPPRHPLSARAKSYASLTVVREGNEAELHTHWTGYVPWCTSTMQVAARGVTTNQAQVGRHPPVSRQHE